MKNSKVGGGDVEHTKNIPKSNETNAIGQIKNVVGSSLARFIRDHWINNPDFTLIRKLSNYLYIATLPYSPFARMSEAVGAYLVAIPKENALQVIHATLSELNYLDAEGDFLKTETPTHCIMVTSNPKQKKSIDDLLKIARNYDKRAKIPSPYVMLELISHLANETRENLNALGMQWLLLGKTVSGKYPVIIIPENKKLPVVICFISHLGQGVTGTTSGLVVFATTK